MTREIHRQAGGFVVVGAIGFVVDGGILTALHELAGLSPVQARFVSFPIAVTVTWYLNRRRTFRDRADRRSGREWLRYSAVGSIGALLNLLVFIWLIHEWPGMSRYPLVPLAIAAGVALVFNFAGSRLYVFRAGRT